MIDFEPLKKKRENQCNSEPISLYPLKPAAPCDEHASPIQEQKSSRKHDR